MKIKPTKYGDYERKAVFNVFSNYTIHVVFTHEIPKSRKARYGTAGLSDTAGALHTSAQGGHAHLFFKIGNCPIGVLAHECWHAVYWMMKEWAGVQKLDNESVAYHLGYLVQKVADFRNQLIDAGVVPTDWSNSIALRQARVLGVKSSSRKQASDGNKDSQGSLVGMQGVSTQRGGTCVAPTEARTPDVSTQANSGGDSGNRRTETGRV